MYLHIGKDCIIKDENIIGIFNLDYIHNNKDYRNMYSRLEEEKKIRNISEKQGKTFILTKEKDKERAYFTNMGVYTIAKRLV